MAEWLSTAISDLPSLAGGLLIGFVFGSVPFGYLLVRSKTGADVRQAGSGNIGATNVNRVLGPAGGLLTLALDAAKGAVGVAAAALLAREVFALPAAQWASAAALGSVLGHCYTPWLGGKGGKGVATLLGAFAVLTPVATLVGTAVLALTAGVSRFVSLASLVGSTALVAATWFLGDPAYTVIAAAIAAAVIIWRHQGNIERLMRGDEARLGGSS